LPSSRSSLASSAVISLCAVTTVDRLLGDRAGCVASIDEGLGRVKLGRENVLAREASDGKGDRDLDGGKIDMGDEGASSVEGGGGCPSAVCQAARAACSSGLARGSNSLSTSFAGWDCSKFMPSEGPKTFGAIDWSKSAGSGVRR